MVGEETVTSAFVSGLWGDEVQLCYSGIKPYKVYDDARTAALADFRPEPRIVYAYGDGNAAFLESIGVTSILLSPDPVPNFTGQAERRTGKSVVHAYGASVWRAKIEFIAKAVEEHDEVVWLDWDIHLVKPLPADFWDRMRERRPFQAALRQLHRRQADWRKHDPRKLHHGGFVYVRGRGVAERLLRLCVEHPMLNDELVYCKLVDEMMGGEFLGPEAYREMGFQPYCYNIVRGMCWPVEDEVFRNTGRW